MQADDRSLINVVKLREKGSAYSIVQHKLYEIVIETYSLKFVKLIVGHQSSGKRSLYKAYLSSAFWDTHVTQAITCHHHCKVCALCMHTLSFYGGTNIQRDKSTELLSSLTSGHSTRVRANDYVCFIPAESEYGQILLMSVDLFPTLNARYFQFVAPHCFFSVGQDNN